MFIPNIFRSDTWYVSNESCGMRRLTWSRGRWQVPSTTRTKQATANKLGIYSKYFLRSSIHFLARCSNFCKPLKKIKVFPFNQVSAAEMIPRRKKMIFQLNFQSSKQMVVRRGLFVKIRWGSIYWNPREARLLWLKLPSEQGRFRESKKHPWWTYSSGFPSKCPSIAPAEISNSPRCDFGLYES